ncbi:MAG TPA: hypothetical protein VLT47_11240 [Anaeromyxobacteraceae bacterium]|nr:hypothetical protein [Anaeromyxobacteraceae bacterium]
MNHGTPAPDGASGQPQEQASPESLGAILARLAPLFEGGDTAALAELLPAEHDLR